jgi:formylglycine-generating enzyme required for sulfatase activity
MKIRQTYSRASFLLHNSITTATKILALALTTIPLLSADSLAPNKQSNQIIPDLKLELIWVNPGSFTMGSPSDEEFRNKAEGPQTQVTLTKGFWLGKTEVTQAQYEAITGENPSTFKNIGKDAPVERVSWIDATAFCEKLTQRERAANRLPDGYAYTLPTEAQWEYACRAATTTAYVGDPETTAWFEKNSNASTHPVAQKRANPWGFHDITGNVIEWCYDWYGNYPGGSLTDPAGPERGYYRIARGGSWRTAERTLRPASRSGGSEGRLDYTIGFRLALAPALAK